MSQLEGKRILITGASSGIGRVVAQYVAREKGQVVLVDRNEERLNETLVTLENGDHNYFCCDLTKEEELKSIVDSIGHLDGVVFCAGVNEFVPVKFINQEKINSMFQINYFSQIILIQKLLKKKLINKGASLVFISSISSLLGTPGTTLYAASKGAINSTVKVLAVELSGMRIRVNAICPGIVRTQMIGNTNISEEQFLEQEKLYPLGLGSPEDVANAVIYHLSEGSRWLTGNIMVLDGGFSLK